jgi:uncharacterized protein (DUF1330 family)
MHYVIAQVNVTDPAVYEEYKALSTRAIRESGGRVLVRGGSAEVMEGDWKPTRLVVIQFDSADKARHWYDSEIYRAARLVRMNASTTQLVIVEGVAT